MTAEVKVPKPFKYKKTYLSIHVSMDLCNLNPCKLGTYCIICYPSLLHYIFYKVTQSSQLHRLCIKGTNNYTWLLLLGFCYG